VSGRRQRDSPWLIALYAIAAVATILTFLFQFNVIRWPFGGPTTSPSVPTGTCEPGLSLSQGSGPSGTTVVVTGTGFPSGESVELRFHTEVLLPAQTDAEGGFSVPVVIPGTFDFTAPSQLSITATTSPTVCSKSVPFGLLE